LFLKVNDTIIIKTNVHLRHDFKRIWWRLFQKRVRRTKLDIYVLKIIALAILVWLIAKTVTW